MNATDAARLAQLGAEVHAARLILGIGQNEFARRAGVDAAVLSKLLRARVLAAPSERKIRAYLRRLSRRAAIRGQGTAA